MKKCYLYTRVSSSNQAASDRDGIPRQRDACVTIAKEKGFTVEAEFSDSITGDAAWNQRPGFLDMVGAILDNGVRAVVVENLTRLARSFVIADQVLVFLAGHGVSLIDASTGEDVTAAMQEDPMKRAIIQMRAVFSELEKASLVRKLRAARQRKKAATGRCEGQKPYGTFPGEEATLARIRELRRNGAGPVRIARALNVTGHQTRKGGPWRPSTVQGILSRV